MLGQIRHRSTDGRARHHHHLMAGSRVASVQSATCATASPATASSVSVSASPVSWQGNSIWWQQFSGIWPQSGAIELLHGCCKSHRTPSQQEHTCARRRAQSKVIRAGSLASMSHWWLSERGTSHTQRAAVASWPPLCQRSTRASSQARTKVTQEPVLVLPLEPFDAQVNRRADLAVGKQAAA